MSSFRIDDNLERHADGAVHCRHCGQTMGSNDNILAHAIWRECEPRIEEGILSEAPSHFIDGEVAMRRAFCPQCLTQLSHEIVPKGAPFLRAITLR